MHLRSCFALLGALVLLCSTAMAQDECLTATAIAEGDTAIDTTAATDSADLLLCTGGGLGAMANDVWFTYTPGSDGDLTVSTCGQVTFDTDIAMYSGGCGALACAGSSGDGAGCPNFSSEFTATVTGGSTYHIRVGGWDGPEAGTGTLTLTLAPVAPPVPGDECVDAFVISAGDTPLDTTGMSTSADALICSGGGLGQMANDVWYSYTPATSGALTVSTCGQAFDTDIAMYSGGCGALVCENSAGDTPGCASFSGEFLDHPVTGGTEYLIRVGGWGATTSGTGTLTLTLSNGDECAEALPISEGDTALDTTGMTTSADALVCSGGGLGQMANDVWYSYTPANDGLLTVSTCDQAFDTDIAMYSGGCGALVCENSAGDTSGCASFSGEFLDHPVTGGTEYLIRVGGWGATTSGTGTLTVTLFVPEICDNGIDDDEDGLTDCDDPDCSGGLVCNPADECADAVDIFAGDTPFSTVFATTSADPFDDTQCTGTSLGQVSNDIWYTYTAAADGLLTVSTCNQAFDTDLILYEGPCGGGTASQVGCDGDGVGCAGFTSLMSDVAVTAGTSYILRVGGWGATTAGSGIISITLDIAGDECDTALTAVEGDNALDTTIMSSSADAYDAAQCAGTSLGQMSNDVWYSFTPVNSGLMTVSTCDQAFDTDIVIYEGPCGGGTASQIACDGDGAGCGGFTSLVADVSVTAGTEYLIRVGGWGATTSGTGTVTISVELPCVDPTPGFSADITTGIAPLDVTFTNTSDDGGDLATTYDWAFGDGGTAATTDASNTYAAGSWDATLTANGCGASITSGATTIVAYGMGDSNCDGTLDLADVLYTADWLFGTGPAPCCPNAANVNGDPNIDLGDVVYTLNFLFTSGAAPIYAGPGC